MAQQPTWAPHCVGMGYARMGAAHLGSRTPSSASSVSAPPAALPNCLLCPRHCLLSAASSGSENAATSHTIAMLLVRSCEAARPALGRRGRLSAALLPCLVVNGSHKRWSSDQGLSKRTGPSEVCHASPVREDVSSSSSYMLSLNWMTNSSLTTVSLAISVPRNHPRTLLPDRLPARRLSCRHRQLPAALSLNHLTALDGPDLPRPRSAVQPPSLVPRDHRRAQGGSRGRLPG